MERLERLNTALNITYLPEEEEDSAPDVRGKVAGEAWYVERRAGMGVIGGGGGGPAACWAYMLLYGMLLYVISASNTALPCGPIP